MSEETSGAAPAAATKPTTEIIRGRMPIVIVALIRFGTSFKDKSTKELADAFGTTVGKVDDIKKNRNFAYVTDAFKPTEQMKADGIAWLKRHPKGADAYRSLVDAVESMPVASADEAAAFEAVRVKARGQPATGADGQPIPGGGGNRRSKGKGKGGDAPAATPSADAVLA